MEIGNRRIVPGPTAARWEASGLRSRGRLGWALERAARERPHAEAVVAADRRATLGELARRADAISLQLLEAGVGRDDVVSWSLPNGVDAIAVAAAIWRIGAIGNPLVTIYRETEFAFAAGQLRPRAVIVASDVRGRALTADVDAALARVGHVPALKLAPGGASGWTRLAEPGDAESLPEGIEPSDPDDPCLVLYTSGTSADPKGVVHSSASLLAEAESMRREWGLSFRDTMLMASPLTHITGLLQGLLVPCIAGARALLMDRWDADACVELAQAEEATYMAGATPFLQGVLDAYARRGGERPSLRQFCCGGAPVAPRLIEEAEARGIAAYRCWGMTELPTATLAGERDPLERRANTDGRRAGGVEIEAVDDRRRPLPPGGEGELRIRGPEAMLGYVGDDGGAAVDAEGWIYTGDVGRVDADGWTTISGRLKDIINRGGEKLSTLEIERLLERHPDVAEVAVVPVPDDRLGEQPCAVVVPRPGTTVDGAALAAFLREQRIAAQKVPVRYEQAAELPRTPAGKVRKHLLVERLGATPASRPATG